MPATPPQDVRYLDLADYLYLAGAALDTAPQAVFDMRRFQAADVGATIDMMVKIAGSEVDPAEVDDWIRRQLH
jgi:hypothetical protein